MSTDRPLTLHHSPNTRSSGTLTLLEELGAPYRLHVLDMKAGEQRQPAYLAVNPMGKVPAIRHGDALITEQVAVFLYLADLFPKAGLAPAIGDPLRGPYLRWMVYYGSCFEPAVVDKVLNTLVDVLSVGPYVLGERFSAVDLLWGTALTWMTGFKLVPDLPVIMDYIGRITARPSGVS